MSPSPSRRRARSRFRRLPVLPLLGCLLMAPAAHAADFGEPSGLGVSLRAGTMGFGAELGGTITPYFGARILAQGGVFHYNTTPSDGDIDYRYKARPFTGGAMLDYRPFAGAFVLTAGGLYQDNELDAVAACPNGCRLNTLQVLPNNTAKFTSDVSFRQRFGPYAGFGFNNDYGRDGLTYGIEVGAFYQGRANVALRAAGQAAFIDNSTGVPVPYASADLARDPIVQRSVEAERQSLESEISRYRFYPNVALKLGFRY